LLDPCAFQAYNSGNEAAVTPPNATQRRRNATKKKLEAPRTPRGSGEAMQTRPTPAKSSEGGNREIMQIFFKKETVRGVLSQLVARITENHSIGRKSRISPHLTAETILEFRALHNF
jgi:hypothetical protein